MVANIETHIAYRCPECGQTIYGFVGKFALSANLLRIKCSCGGSALDINITNDKKIRLSVPCIFCRQNHSFVVSESIFFGREKFLLNNIAKLQELLDDNKTFVNNNLLEVFVVDNGNTLKRYGKKGINIIVRDNNVSYANRPNIPQSVKKKVKYAKTDTVTILKLNAL